MKQASAFAKKLRKKTAFKWKQKERRLKQLSRFSHWCVRLESDKAEAENRVRVEERNLEEETRKELEECSKV